MKLANLLFKIFVLLFLPSSLLFSNIDISANQKQLLENIPPDQRDSILAKMNKASELEDELNEIFEEESTLIEKRNKEEIDLENLCEKCIFGYDFFQYAPTTFVPLNNIPISSSYILGPGDKLEINFYGSVNAKQSSYISRTGEIQLQSIGPVSLLGLSFEEATKLIKNKVATELMGTEASISLEELRSISVYVLGEAHTPGQYTMSGLSSVANALFVSGGVSENGSLRNIEIKRNDKLIAKYDFYEFLLQGSIKSDIRLQDGDIIFIPFIENKVKVGGAFRRPHYYEIVKGETLEDLIELAGGFSSFEVLDQNKLEFSTFNKDLGKREIFTYNLNSRDLQQELKDGDTLNLSSSTITDSKTVEISGEVRKPGMYTILPGETVLDLLDRAGGYTDKSFSEGIVFLRKTVADQQKQGYLRSADQLEEAVADLIMQAQQEQNIQLNEFSLVPVSKIIERLRKEIPPGRMVVNLDYLSLKKDPYLNFELNDGDTLHVPRRPNFISVVGEVLNSTTLLYNANLSLEDYLMLAGGIKDTADEDKIFVIYPDGKSEVYKQNLFRGSNELMPGSTIVVSRASKTYDATTLARIITPILADLATSAAAIAAIND